MILEAIFEARVYKNFKTPLISLRNSEHLMLQEIKRWDLIFIMVRSTQIKPLTNDIYLINNIRLWD